MSHVERTIERLRDARQRLRLGLPVADELDELLDDAAELLEDAESAIILADAIEHGETREHFDERRATGPVDRW